MPSSARSKPSRYLVRNPVLRAWLRLSDIALAISRPKAQEIGTKRDRIMVCIGGHLGDAVLATKAISELHRALPRAQMGVLTGSWNRTVFDGDPRIRWVHTVDHWKLNRAGASLFTRWRRYRRSRRDAITEMRAIGYDVAVDLYAYYPNFAPIVAAAEIPTRIGYASGGFAARYTRALPDAAGASVVEDYRRLIEELLPQIEWNDASAYDMPPVGGDARAAFRERLRERGAPARYALLHMTGGLPHKEWPLDRWITVARELAQQGLAIVLTGAGQRASAHAQLVRSAMPAVISFVNELSWEEFRCAIAEASVVSTIDTVALHLAAAAGVPTTAIVPGIEPFGRWAAPSARLEVFTAPVPCSPCFRSKGCADMRCIRAVDVRDVLHAIERQLSVSP